MKHVTIHLGNGEKSYLKSKSIANSKSWFSHHVSLCDSALYLFQQAPNSISLSLPNDVSVILK